MNAPALLDRSRRLESLFTAICCIEGTGTPANPDIRKMVVCDLLALAAEQTTLAHEAAERALEH